MLRCPAKPQICQQVQALGQEIIDMQDVTLKLETRCSWVLSFTLRPLHPYPPGEKHLMITILLSKSS